MAFALKPHKKAAKEVRRAAREQVDRALAEIADDALGEEKTVHQVRKRCKKLRGLLRLVADDLGKHYKMENHWYRDTARLLSGLRDAHQSANTLAQLGAEQPADVGTGAGDRAGAPDARDALAQCDARLREGRERIDQWPLAGESFDALQPGFKHTYAQGRKRLRAARKSGEADALHDWRKAVKYHGHHLKLMRPSWPVPLSAHYREVSRLGDFLGEEHDLSVLALRLEAARANGEEEAEQLLERLARRQRKLRRRAFRLGEHVFAEKPKSYSRRLAKYWRASAG